jgi:hypothetical protein
VFGHWLEVHTGTVNEPGPYYGFWSGFGSDLTEFGIIGAIATGVYQLFRKYNCHQPGCWRVGNHPAAGGQFSLCYRHHPDYQGTKPTHEMIQRLHREHLERQAAMAGKLQEVHERLTAKPAAANGAVGPGGPTAPPAGGGEAVAGSGSTQPSDGSTQTGPGTLDGTSDPAQHVRSR